MKYSVNTVKAALGEVQNTLRWQLVMKKAPPAGGAFPADLQIRVQTAAAPTATPEHNKVQLGGHTINFVGKLTKNGTIQLGFVEGTDAKVTTYFLRLLNAYWSSTSGDTQGNSAKTADLKGDFDLIMMDGNNVTTQGVSLVGAIFSADLSASLGQDSASLLRNVTVDFDDFHPYTPEITW